MPKENKLSFLKVVLGCLVVLDILVWYPILFSAEAKNLEMYFLDVGQGDSSLVKFPGGVKMLIDAGPPNGKLEENLEKILPLNDRYIDLVVISHPQLDHFGGFLSALKKYKVGAVITSHANREVISWQELERVMREEGIRRIVLNTRDKIRYGDSLVTILSPDKGAVVKEVNDLSLAMLLESGGSKSLFVGDVSAKLEKQLANLYDVDVDILKVSHHGSKFSSDPVFLKEASPVVSVIEVGKNSYGHPTKEALGRLANFSLQVYRTDKDGLVKLVVDSGKVKVYSQR